MAAEYLPGTAIQRAKMYRMTNLNGIVKTNS
jgi:hypothetical protein